jgi:ABC-type Fe3+ transport system substrate-binding protein
MSKAKEIQFRDMHSAVNDSRRDFLKSTTAFAAYSMLAGMGAAPAFAQSAAGQAAGFDVAKGQESLKALIEKAKKEPDEINGHLTLAFLPVAKKVNDLFNAQFGLKKNINILEGVDNTFTSQMIQASKMGGVPDLIFYASDDDDMPFLVRDGYVDPIADWQNVLSAINPRIAEGKYKPSDLSPNRLGGYAFAFSNRLNGVGFNKSVPAGDLPKTYADLADPKYAGHFAIEPWTAHWEALGYNYYPDHLDDYLKMLNAIGKNAYVVSRSYQLVPRIALGEFGYMPLHIEVVSDFLQKNPGAPLDYYFMDDMAFINTTFMFIPKKCRAPATAALYILYFSHPDVQALRGPNAPNVMYGELPSDNAIREHLKNKKAWSWGMNDSTVKYLEWLDSKDGASFRDGIVKAVRQRN